MNVTTRSQLSSPLWGVLSSILLDMNPTSTTQIYLHVFSFIVHLGVNDRRPLFCNRGAPTVLTGAEASGQIAGMMGSKPREMDAAANGMAVAATTSCGKACCTDGILESKETAAELDTSFEGADVSRSTLKD